jgi:ABC-2 type transport system permease protein
MTPPETDSRIDPIAEPGAGDGWGNDDLPAPDLARSGSGPLASPSTGWRPLLRKYSMIYRVSLAERMTYRADFLITTIFRFLPTITTILLWSAIFDGAGSNTLAGFTYEQTICYLLIVNISRMFSSMPGLAGGIASEVRDGTLKKYLIQPLDLIAYLLSYRMAHKSAYIIGTALPYALLFGVCYKFFIGNVPTDPMVWAAYLASLLMAFLIGFFFEASVGMVGFWFLEITSILWVVMTLNFFISGQMLPLDFLPPFWAGLLKLLPFQYMAYFPAVVFLEKVQGWDLVKGLVLELFWVVFFVVLCRWLYKRGLRQYGAYGG